TVRATNGGQGDLTITEIARSGSSEFRILASDGSAVAFPLVIEPGEVADFLLRLETADADGHASTFEFRSDDPTGARTLRAERSGPDGSFPTWATVLIVIGAIAAAVAVGVGAYLLYDHFQDNDEIPVQPPD
ncbi:MAG TPA: hypothetical protein VLA09_05910, partial [Longimicrobiales bacterium]|nr:hypothetical protein [Longimicrobiales bacterium]